LCANKLSSVQATEKIKRREEKRGMKKKNEKGSYTHQVRRKSVRSLRSGDLFVALGTLGDLTWLED